jgi:hypothetical protein
LLVHAGIDVFITSPVAASLPNVMGALLAVGTALLIPAFGSENLSRRPRVVESDGGTRRRRHDPRRGGLPRPP